MFSISLRIPISSLLFKINIFIVSFKLYDVLASNLFLCKNNTRILMSVNKCTKMHSTPSVRRSFCMTKTVTVAVLLAIIHVCKPLDMLDTIAGL